MRVESLSVSGEAASFGAGCETRFIFRWEQVVPVRRCWLAGVGVALQPRHLQSGYGRFFQPLGTRHPRWFSGRFVSLKTSLPRWFSAVVPGLSPTLARPEKLFNFTLEMQALGISEDGKWAYCSS